MMNSTVPGKNTRPKLGFVASVIGKPSEPWMYRQLVGFTRFETFALTWEHLNRDRFPVEKDRMDVISVPAGYSEPPVSRLLNKVRRRMHRNIYGYVEPQHTEIGKWLERTQPDVVLCQYGPVALRVLAAARPRNVPVVPHFHGFDLSSSLNQRPYRKSLLANLHSFPRVVCVGKHQRELLESFGLSSDRIHQIPCGVPTDDFTPAAPRKDPVVRFLAVSRLVEKKGLVYTIRAFSHVVEAVEEPLLRILGDGPLQEELMALAEELKISKQVIFEGAVSSERVREALREADVFVQHSIVASNADSEGFPISTAEAAASGLPIVSTLSPGIIEQVEDGVTGFLVEQKDDEAMAEKMILLAKDRELRTRMGQAARKLMVENFDTQDQIAKLEGTG